jgi:hypothetical protein
MELIINVAFPNGQISAKLESFEEAAAVKAWLIEQGLIAGEAPRAPAAEQVVDVQTSEPAETATADHSATIAQAKAEIKAAEPEAKPTRKPRATKPEPEAPAATITEVTKAVTDYAAKFGPAEARALFSRFGVSRGGDLKPEQFADFIATATDYLVRGVKASEAEMPEGAEESLM